MTQRVVFLYKGNFTNFSNYPYFMKSRRNFLKIRSYFSICLQKAHFEKEIVRGKAFNLKFKNFYFSTINRFVAPFQREIHSKLRIPDNGI